MRAPPILLLCASIAAGAPGGARGAPAPPSADAVLRAVYPRYDPSTHTTGERGTACGIEGRRTASLVALKPWRGLGRDQWVALFAIWVREDATPADADPSDDGWAQACGPRPALVALLEAGPSGPRVVARSGPDLEADALDLAPYRLRPGETLVGARRTWMNHGFGDTRLTLLRVAGDRLTPVAEIPVEVTAEAVTCTGTVSVIPVDGAPASLRVTWKITVLDDDASERSAGTEQLTWRFAGSAYAPDPGEAARVKRCTSR